MNSLKVDIFHLTWWKHKTHVRYVVDTIPQKPTMPPPWWSLRLCCILSIAREFRDPFYCGNLGVSGAVAWMTYLIICLSYTRPVSVLGQLTDLCKENLVGGLRSSYRRTLKPLRSDHTIQTNEVFMNSPSLEIFSSDRLSFHWKQQESINTSIAEFCDSGDGNVVWFTGFHDWHFLQTVVPQFPQLEMAHNILNYKYWEFVFYKRNYVSVNHT